MGQFKIKSEADFTELEADSLAVTTGASPVAITLEEYASVITTGGTAGSETVTLPNGEYIGQRKLISLGTRTNASDKVVFAEAASVVSKVKVGLGYGGTPKTLDALELDAANEFVLLEWAGSFWNIVYANATVTETA